jgi:hypothetical protein
MQVSGKVCIGGIIGIIIIVAVLYNIFHALISVPIILYCKTRRACSRQRIINVCIHQLELARNPTND